MKLRIFIGVYFSVCASLSTAIVEYVFMDGASMLSIVSALFTFPFGFYFSSGYVNYKYDKPKSALIGISIMLLSLLSFFMFWGINSFITTPDPVIQQVIFGLLSLFFVTIITMGIIIFPTAAISGALLYSLLLRRSNVANKALKRDSAKNAAPLS